MLPKGGRLELFLPMTAFARGEAGAREAARSAARSRAEGALISALAPRTAMSHFLISDEIGKLRLRYNALVIWHVRIIVSN